MQIDTMNFNITATSLLFDLAQNKLFLGVDYAKAGQLERRIILVKNSSLLSRSLRGF